MVRVAAAVAGLTFMPQTGSIWAVAVVFLPNMGVSFPVVWCWVVGVSPPISTTGVTGVTGVGVWSMGCGAQRRSRLALVTTDSEDSAMAAAATMGLSRIPKTG